MAFLKWLGGIVLLFWLIGLIIGGIGKIIHILLLVAVVVFVVDYIMGKSRP